MTENLDCTIAILTVIEKAEARVKIRKLFSELDFSPEDIRYSCEQLYLQNYIIVTQTVSSKSPLPHIVTILRFTPKGEEALKTLNARGNIKKILSIAKELGIATFSTLIGALVSRII